MITGFERYKEAIAALPISAKYEKQDLLCDQFLLFMEGKLETFYAPSDYINRKPRVVLVGITPGWTQMELAYRAARRALAESLADEEVLRRVKTTGSFGGRMRKNLVCMLDGIERTPKRLGAIPGFSRFYGHFVPLVHGFRAIGDRSSHSDAHSSRIVAAVNAVVPGRSFGCLPSPSRYFT